MAGAILFQLAARPRFLTVTTLGVGSDRQALAVTYPADWVIVDTSVLSDVGPPTRETFITLTQKPATGLQHWLDEHVLRVRDSELSDSYLTIFLQRLDGPVNLSRESARLASGFDQMYGPNGTVRIRNTSCPIGPMIECDIQDGSSGDTGEFRGWYAYPTPSRGADQYEVVVRYNTTARLKSRMRQTALDVVSHLKLVKRQ